MDSNLKKLVAYTIEQLPPQEKAVLSLYYHEEMNFKDIARIMDMRTPEGLPDAPRVRRLYIRGVTKVFGFKDRFGKDYLEKG